MFFKRRVNVREYCTSKMESLTAPESAQTWAALHKNSNDAAFLAVPMQQVADELLAAHVQLMSCAIAKEYHNVELYMGAGMSIKAFFSIRSNSGWEATKDAYNKAFGSSPADGVLEMAKLFNHRLANGRLAEQTVKSVYDLMYRALGSFYDGFSRIRLVFKLGA